MNGVVPVLNLFWKNCAFIFRIESVDCVALMPTGISKFSKGMANA
jgi:hypothetical protein